MDDMTAGGKGLGKIPDKLAQQMPDRFHACPNLLPMHGKTSPPLLQIAPPPPLLFAAARAG